MEFHPIAYRILNYLKPMPNPFVVTHNEILKSIHCIDRDDFTEGLFFLNTEKLIDGGKTYSSISPQGRSYLRNIENQMEQSAYEYVHKDYDYCVIKFLYENNWGVRIEEFLTIIKKTAPDSQMNSEGNLVQYLNNQRDFIEEKNSSYYLNDIGIRHYLLDTGKKKEEKEAKTVGNVSVGQFGDIIHNNGFNNSVLKGNIIENATEKISIWKKLLGDVRAVIVGYIIVAIVSFFTGKSCNNTASHVQPTNSIHSIK